MIANDRWTCNSCGRTVVIIAAEEDFRCCLTDVQTMHGNTHRHTDTGRTRRLVRALERQDRKRRAS